MQEITSVKELKLAIRQLESEQKLQAELLKSQFSKTAVSLNPMNILTGLLKDFLTSPIVMVIGIETIRSYGHRLIERISSRLFKS